MKKVYVLSFVSFANGEKNIFAAYKKKKSAKKEAKLMKNAGYTTHIEKAALIRETKKKGD